MGSRPTRVRSVDIEQERVNGSVSKVTISELQTENDQLKKRLSDLENVNSEKLIRENDRLKKQNEDLRMELIKLRESSQVDMNQSVTFPVKKSSDLSAGNGHHHDMLSDTFNLTPSPSIDRRIHSDRSSSPGCSSCKTSPNVNDGRKRKIDPNSVLQRMSDIDAYGQGLPLADSSLMVKSVRRTRHRKRKTTTTQATNSKDDSPTNSEGTTSPAEVMPNTQHMTPKSSEDGQADSGIHSTDVEQQGDPNQNQEPNDILMT